jgi:extracellular factor (EF) 3-hydroxypalmitic acid methyl ester biosynthesis protein
MAPPATILERILSGELHENGMTATEFSGGLVGFETDQGVEIRGSILRMTRHVVAFELYLPSAVLRTSEVLHNFKIVVDNLAVYTGQAVVRSLVNAGLTLVCEVSLNESGLDAVIITAHDANGDPNARFRNFLQRWQRNYKVRPEFKAIVADLHTLLTDLRLWLDEMELGIRALPDGNRADVARTMLSNAGGQMVETIDALHERFEEIVAGVEIDLRPAHQSLAQRQLRSLFLCSPFGYRAYSKPLGYAGDYEMVNMITRDPLEGSTLFAKVMNLWLLEQWPSKAHRNRIASLHESLIQETARTMRHGRPCRILNLGCGPAREIQLFMENSLSNHAEFTLFDFNDETLNHTAAVLGDLRGRSGRSTRINVQKKSVQRLLREATKPGQDQKFDFIYCAGLFDYLPDRVCKELISVFYEWLAADGLVLTTNVVDCKPFRHMLEFVLDWHLIYRDRKQAVALLPESPGPVDVTFKCDDTGVNLFIEVRKLRHA